MFPILFFQFYLGMTVFIFAFGPWPWPVQNPLLLYLYLLAAQVSLWLGYKSGLRVRPGGYYCYGPWTIKRILKISLILNLAWIIPGYMMALNLDAPDVGQLLSRIWLGINDPGSAYRLKFTPLEERVGSPLGYVGILISPVLWMLLPLSIVYWTQLSNKFRLCFVFVIVANLFKWVALGTTKGIADFAILSITMLAASNANFLDRSKSLKRRLKILLYAGFVLMLLLFCFLYMQYGRRGGAYTNPYNYNADIGINYDNWMLLTKSEAGIGAISSVTSYLTQGYYGLSLALNEDFQWSYGVGNSLFLIGIFEKFAGRGTIFDKTYPARVEKYGWGAHNNWHSFYTWIASDVTFTGAIILVFFIGRIFAMTWIDTLKKENPFAVSMLALLVIMLMYFPANNQVLAFGHTWPAFFAILCCWLFTKKRHNWLLSGKRLNRPSVVK